MEASRATGCEAVRYTVSIGIAWSVPGAQGLSELLHQADLAMYEAKRQGRNCVRVAGAITH